jgi:hypothetical protein
MGNRLAKKGEIGFKVSGLEKIRFQSFKVSKFQSLVFEGLRIDDQKRDFQRSGFERLNP